MRISDWSSDVCSSDLFFENQARKMAEAIETAAANLKPARMGATQIHHRVYKGNVVRLATAIDGTPAGYPLEYNDHRSEERRVGKECVSTCRSRWSPYH